MKGLWQCFANWPYFGPQWGSNAVRISQLELQNVALMIRSKTLPENDDSEAFESILQIGHRFLRNEVRQEFLSKSSKMSVWWKGTKKLAENEDWEACDSTMQISNLFGHNGVQRDFYNKGSKLTLWW